MKVKTSAIDELAQAPRAEYVVVTSGIAVEAVELAQRGNPNLRGDAFTAATLAAARSAAELVRINVWLGKLGTDQ